MPAVRKPTAVLEAAGSFKKNRARTRKGEPDTGRGVGPAPEWLDETERAMWDEIVGDCAPGVFQSSDRVALTAMARLLAEFRHTPALFGARKYALLLTFLARFGMTPSDRSRVVVREDEPTEKPKTGLASFRR